MVLAIIGAVALFLLFVLAVAAMWVGTVYGDITVTMSSSRRPRLIRS